MSRNKTAKEKTSWKEEARIFIRAAKINYRISPALVWINVVNSIGDTIRPILNAYLSALIINRILAGDSFETLVGYAVLTVVLQFVVNMAVRFTANRRYVRRSVWQNMCANYLNTVSGGLDYEYFENPKVRDLFVRITRANEEERGLPRITSMLWTVTCVITALAGSLAALAASLFAKAPEPVSGVLGFVNQTWIVGVFLVVLIVKTFLENQIQVKASKRQFEISREYSHVAAIGIRFYELGVRYQNGMDLRIFGEDETIKAETKHFVQNPWGVKSMEKIFLQTNSLVTILNHIFVFFAWCFVAFKAMSGAFSIGNLVLYTGALNSFSYGISQLSWLLPGIRETNRYLRELLEYVDLPCKMYQGTLSVEKRSDNDYTIEFCDVSFRYPSSEEYALRHVNMKFKIGERLAVVGMNGSGKTTFIKLLCRLYDPTEGHILLNGIDITRYKYEEYLALFSVVFQDFKLFAFSLGQNVATSCDYDADRVRKCLEEVGFGERLDAMPHGLDTCLYKNFDSDGVEISGGEAQKIALARAVYKNGPFILLDEPTAALDPIAEFEIYTKFNEIVEDKTTLYISHRLSSCRFCDTIIVFDKGQIVGRGTHESLLADEGGKYAELWYAQAGYYTEEKQD